MGEGRPEPQGQQDQGWVHSPETLACLFQPPMVRQGHRASWQQSLRHLGSRPTIWTGNSQSEGRGKSSGAKIEASRRKFKPSFLAKSLHSGSVGGLSSAFPPYSPEISPERL